MYIRQAFTKVQLTGVDPFEAVNRRFNIIIVIIIIVIIIVVIIIVIIIIIIIINCVFFTKK